MIFHDEGSINSGREDQLLGLKVSEYEMKGYLLTIFFGINFIIMK